MSLVTNYGVLMIGNEIKNIRKILGITQVELSGGKIARNAISEIESGNTKLISKNAIEFAYQFLYYSLKKQIFVDLDNYIDSLEFSSEKESLKKTIYICNIILDHSIYKENNEKLSDIETFVATIHHNLLRYYILDAISEVHNNNNSLNSYLNLKLKGLDILILESEHELLSISLHSLIPYLIKLKKNHTFITTAITSINIFLNNNISFDNDLYYFISLCFLRLNQFDNAISYIDKYLVNEVDKTAYAIGILHKANIYSRSNSYNIARDLYSQASILLIQNEDYVNYSISISNIIDLITGLKSDIDEESFKSVEYYCSLLNNIIKNLSGDESIYRVQSKLALGYSFTNNCDKALSIFNELLDNTAVTSDISLLSSILADSLNFYYKTGSIDNLSKYINILIDLHEDNELDDYCEKIILKFIKYNIKDISIENIFNKYMNLKYHDTH